MKGEAAALSVRAQRCQSHYFSTTPRMSYILRTACVQDQNGTEFHSESPRKLSEKLYDIYHCCVYSEKIPDDWRRNCSKHVEFHCK